MKKLYINAVTELLLLGRDVNVVLKNLEKVLVEKGHKSIHVEILKGILKELSNRQKMEASTVIVASSKDAALFKEVIEASLKELEGNLKEAHFVTDETLIGGYIATHEGRLINRSYKEKLVSLYRSLTT